MPSRAILLALLLIGAGCGERPWIVGKFQDSNWQAKGRVDSWEFTEKGSWTHVTTFNGRPSVAENGNFSFDGKVLKRVWKHLISYRADGTVRRDITDSFTEATPLIKSGQDMILDPENKTTEGKTELDRVK